MKLLSKKDVLYAIITGITAGLLAWIIFKHLGKPTTILLVIIVPILWILGVQLGYFLGRWVSFFDQFGKFAAIGFTNFAVDAGVLNLLMYLTGITGGAGFTVWKSISFVVAVTHSYLWNKLWTFQSRQTAGKEFIKFMTVMIASWLINVGVASLVLFIMGPSVAHANIAAVIGSAVALIFSFIGFKVVVFK